ncbi:unnamed protein product [Peniophora sp. CBMAI 1063]|nr:unnamed protein product [Peniophora sp. CBMAI 1063]
MKDLEREREEDMLSNPITAPVIPHARIRLLSPMALASTPLGIKRSLSTTAKVKGSPAAAKASPATAKGSPAGQSTPYGHTPPRGSSVRYTGVGVSPQTTLPTGRRSQGVAASVLAIPCDEAARMNLVLGNGLMGGMDGCVWDRENGVKLAPDVHTVEGVWVDEVVRVMLDAKKPDDGSGALARNDHDVR